MGICTREICIRGSPYAKLSEKHISDCLYLHNEVVRRRLSKLKTGSCSFGGKKNG